MGAWDNRHGVMPGCRQHAGEDEEGKGAGKAPSREDAGCPGCGSKAGCQGRVNPMRTLFVIGAGLMVSAVVHGLGAQAPEAKPAITMSGEGKVEPPIDKAMVQERYDRGKALLAAGDHVGALNDFLWCFDIGMPAVPSFAGVRVSFLVGDIKRLAAVYPLARQALEERCDAAEKRFLTAVGERTAGVEFAGLMRAVGDEPRFMKAFDSLPADDVRRKGLGVYAYQGLLGRRRYAEALEIFDFAWLKQAFEAQRKRPPVMTPRGEDLNRNLAIRYALDAIEALAGAGKLAEAREFVGWLVEYDASAKTQEELEQRLQRAGQPELLRAVDDKKR